MWYGLHLPSLIYLSATNKNKLSDHPVYHCHTAIKRCLGKITSFVSQIWKCYTSNELCNLYFSWCYSQLCYKDITTLLTNCCCFVIVCSFDVFSRLPCVADFVRRACPAHTLDWTNAQNKDTHIPRNALIAIFLDIKLSDINFHIMKYNL